MGGAVTKKASEPPQPIQKDTLALPGTSDSDTNSGKAKKGILKRHDSLSDFSLTDLASNLTNRFSVLSGLNGLSFMTYVPVSTTSGARRPWSKISRKKWRNSTLKSDYGQCKTVWPVAQTEALFLPDFPVGIDEKLKLILIGEIGRGAFGQVFHVSCSSTKREFAMKVLSKAQVCSLDAVHQVKQEVMIQHMCSHHPFITPLVYFWQTRKLLIVMTEYIGYGELQQLWRSLRRFPEELISLYVAELACAIDFLHNAGVIYRDLKMENILLDADGHIKLIDFGLSRWLSYGKRTGTICGTLQFMAPEVLGGEDYGHSADWWSLGIIAYSLLAGHYPVSGCPDHVSMKAAVDQCTYPHPPGATTNMKYLLSALLQRSPSLRIHSLTMLQKEPMYTGVNFEDVKEKKVAPRVILEHYIEGKSRHNFEEFQGLTSTPKKSTTVQTNGVAFPSSPVLSKPSRSPLMGGRAIMWDRAKRSSSSPLLSSPLKHPPRLGHHDALIKSVSATGYNGAAVPLLQSPLLRLARGQTVGCRGKKTQKAVSVSVLPTAVSPLLVNVRGNRKSRINAKDDSSIFKRNRPDSSLLKMDNLLNRPNNGTYPKCSSVDCMTDLTKGSASLRRSHTATNQMCPRVCSEDKIADGDALSALEDGVVQNGCAESYGDKFFLGPVTSTPKRESKANLDVDSSGQIDVELNLKTAVNDLRLTKSTLVNGNVLRRNISLEDKELDEVFEGFPWISESLEP